jgi:hypothetical protein
VNLDLSYTPLVAEARSARRAWADPFQARASYTMLNGVSATRRNWE